MRAFDRIVILGVFTALGMLSACGGQPSATGKCPVFALYLTTQRYGVGDNATQVHGKLLATQSDVVRDALIISEQPFPAPNSSGNSYSVSVLFTSDALHRMRQELSGPANSWIFTFVFEGKVIQSGGGTTVPAPASMGPFPSRQEAQHFVDVLHSDQCR